MRGRLKLIIGFLLLIGTGGLFYFFPPSFLKVQEVVVQTPLKHLSNFDLIRLSEVKRGENLFRLPLSAIRSRILRFPWIREVRLSKRFPGRLVIWAEEEEPVALVDQEGLFLVNREGVIFKKVGPSDPKDLPLISGLTPSDLSSHLKPLISLISSFENSALLHPIGVSEVQWTPQQGVSLFTREPCVRVDMGKEGWEEKLDRLEGAWEAIRTTARRPKVVDLTFEKRIVVKSKDQKIKGGG